VSSNVVPEISAWNATANANELPKSGWRRLRFEEMPQNSGD